MDKRLLIKRPIVTEKSNKMNENGIYMFAVDRKANKLSIKEAIEKMYGVTVERVNTMVCIGKPKSRYTKAKVVTGRTATYKKAIVKVVEGDFIDLYGNF
jgi:large subunit ribosomal protein L23